MGYSSLRVEQFLGIIRRYDIRLVIDVRSSPYSKFSSQFNGENLEITLGKENVVYRFEGDALGARRKERKLQFEDGVVDFSKVRAEESFKQAIDSIVNDLKGSNVAIMCAEKDPFDCHRFVLVSKALVDKGIEVKHILSDGSVIDNRELEVRLRKTYAQRDLFSDFGEKENSIDELYEKRNRDIGYKADVSQE
jgi:uncharacterized protein (DUF488 family)